MWIANAAPFIALLPVFLEIIDRGLDYLGFLGPELSYERLRSPVETRQLLKDEFVTPANGRSLFMDVWAYAEFDQTGADIIKFHFVFMVSLYFGAVAETKDFAKIEGWPLIGIGVLIISLFVFLLGFLRNKYHPAHRRAFFVWQVWTLVIFVAIIVFEGRNLVTRT